MFEQISLFEHRPALIPDNNKITDLQLEKVYKNIFCLKKDTRKIEQHDITAVIDCLSYYTKSGCLGIGIGWDESNHTIVDIDRRGIEFDHNGKVYSFYDIAALLIRKYGK